MKSLQRRAFDGPSDKESDSFIKHNISKERLPTFTQDIINSSPSRLDGLTADEELLWTRQCVELIRTAGARLREHMTKGMGVQEASRR